MSKEEMQQKMELQLHEQYAINNNANMSSILALFGTLVVVMGVFYKVFCATESIEKMNITNPYILLFVGMLGVLYIIFFISLFQGVKQRCEQFIIFAIRAKYYSDVKNEVAPNSTINNRIFSKGYHPFGKSCFSMIQGIYQYICTGCIITAVFMSVVSIQKFEHCCCFLLMFVIFLTCCIISYCIQREKYNAYGKDYAVYNPTSEQ